MKIKNRRIIDRVKELGLRDGEYAVFGSGLMEVLGMRKSGDIDLLVTRWQFENMGEGWGRYVYENNGDEAMKYDGGDFDVAFWYCRYFGLGEEEVLGFIGRAEVIDGVRFVNLQDTIAWKMRGGREKDLRDVEMIKKYIEEEV